MWPLGPRRLVRRRSSDLRTSRNASGTASTTSEKRCRSSNRRMANATSCRSCAHRLILLLLHGPTATSATRLAGVNQ
eukprot:4317047-Alexandrium_andersonii.AAC.1